MKTNNARQGLIQAVREARNSLDKTRDEMYPKGIALTPVGRIKRRRAHVENLALQMQKLAHVVSLTSGNDDAEDEEIALTDEVLEGLEDDRQAGHDNAMLVNNSYDDWLGRIMIIDEAMFYKMAELVSALAHNLNVSSKRRGR